jgi:hypothetical protein
VADHKKQRTTRVNAKRAGKQVSNVFARLNCEMASYDFDRGLDAFDLDKFYKETGLSAEDRNWSTVFYAQDERSGYHVHFRGRVKGKKIELTVAYYVRSRTRPKKPPFAETAMVWLGSFFRKPMARAWVSSMFNKPTTTWRSRFNLPFKVTMTGSNTEVVIDGISLDLPTNEFGAKHGWLTRLGAQFTAMAVLTRPVTFATFKIEKEVPVYNEALKIFIEEVK